MIKKGIVKGGAIWLMAFFVFLQAGVAWGWFGFGGSKEKAADSMMPHFVLSSAVAGPDLDSEELQGRVLLINFWATWCGPCVEEYPDLMRLHEVFADQGFAVIGISTDKSKRAVTRFAEKYGHVYPLLMANAAVVRDFGAGIGLPVSFLVDRQGKIIKRYYGPRTFEQFAEDIETVL